ncbi:MAG: Lrp/AsnC family transcriptional regulator [Exiguobacterium profundum]|nr:MAG: Lrp/AsnC family transcriptional regulator [Exiguobacterium profundum]
MDELDRNIVGLLGADARMSVATLARRLKVARSTIQARLERLETTGIIAGYTIKLGEAAREGRLRATILVTIEPRSQGAILARLKSIPEVERVHTTSGRFDLLLQVAAPNAAQLDRVLDEIGVLTGVRSSESLIHLSTRFDRAV